MRLRFRSHLACGVLGLLFLGPTLTTWASDWPRFRGPNGSGISPDTEPTPVEWSPTSNLLWKVPLPGAGVSCPIVVGDRIFVTCYSGYGVERGNLGRPDDLKRHLVCIDRKTGKELWQKTIDAVLPEDPFTGMGVPEHGYASHTPVSDGEHVYVFFGKTGALAFDLAGNQLWKVGLGTESDPRRWGSSSSPIVYEDKLIVPAGAENRAVVALDKKTGKELWRAEAEGLGDVWGSPAISKVDDTRTDIVIGAPFEIWGLNPKTGKLTWHCDANDSNSFNTSVVVDEGTIYAVEGRSGGSIAVKAGGKGDVTKTNVLWTGSDVNRFGTPVVYQKRLYFVANGIVNCLSAETGKKVFQSRLPASGRDDASPEPNRVAGGPPAGPGAGGPGPGGPGGPGGRGGRGRGGMGGGPGGGDYSSPVIADGKLYFVTRGGDMHVLKASDKFEHLATNRVTTDREDFSATPAISQGVLYYRSNKFLYAVGKK